jgi:hypothetical protein
MRSFALLFVAQVVVGGSACATEIAGALDEPGAPAPLGTAVSAALASGVIVNGLQWADTAGNPIQAHGAGIVRSGAFYYWFGENRNPDFTFKAVSIYRSTDLRSWEFRGNALSQSSAAELGHANIERPKVVFNAATGQFVMWMHWENGTDYTEARAAVASAATIEGPYLARPRADRPLPGPKALTVSSVAARRSVGWQLLCHAPAGSSAWRAGVPHAPRDSRRSTGRAGSGYCTSSTGTWRVSPSGSRISTLWYATLAGLWS